MCREFERYGLSKLNSDRDIRVTRRLSSLVGILYPVILLLSSGGLSLLMFLGCITRIRARDPRRNYSCFDLDAFKWIYFFPNISKFWLII